MNTRIDLSTIPASPLSPEWDVPSTTTSSHEPCGHFFVFQSGATQTELGHSIKQVAIEFQEFMREDPSLEATKEFLRHWKDVNTNRIPPMVLEWLDFYDACAIAAESNRLDIVEYLLECGFQLSGAVAFNLFETAKKNGDMIMTLEFITENGWDLNALMGRYQNTTPVLW
jgi:hypothetical protein